MPASGWSRPRWQSTCRFASLFYFIPTRMLAERLELSVRRYGVSSIPDDLRVSAHERSTDAVWFAGFFSEPGLGNLLKQSLGSRAEEIRSADAGVIVRGHFQDSENLEYLRAGVAVVSAIVEGNGYCVLDLPAARWWTPEEWAMRFVEHTDFRIQDHIQFLVSDDDRYYPGLWVHTRGMAKFGRPDLQIKHVPTDRVEDAGTDLSRFVRYLIDGAVIRDGEEVEGMIFRYRDNDAESADCHFGNDTFELRRARDT